MQTATPGEDVMAILARAQLFEEYVMEPLAAQDSTTLPGVMLDRD